MYYTIYVIYNLINGKEYIGKHQTQNINDNYIGSGRLIQRAITKYGKDNFIKDILYVFNTELEMNNKEKQLVTEEYISSKLSYNLCPGGYGGFGYINKHNLCTGSKTGNCGFRVLPKEFNLKQSSKGGRISFERKIGIFKYSNKERSMFFKGKVHKEESKRKIGKANSLHQQGVKNSQFGTCWITNGKENKKIKKEKLALYINQGYYKGRIS